MRALAVAALLLTGCALPPADLGEAGAGEAAFVREVAASRSPVPVAGQVGNWQVSGIYAGDVDGCARVTLRWLALRRETHHAVCNGQVREIHALAPALPQSAALTRLRHDSARNAWAQGVAVTGRFEDYTLEAVPVGPADGQGCRSIEDRVLYEGLLVDRRRVRIC